MANPQLPIGQTEDNDDNVFFDLLAAPFRGVEGAVQGAYNLVDFVTFDILPDYDEKFLGKSTTVAGSAVEGISQFMTGFIPIFGWAGRAGTLAKAGSLTQKALSGTVSRGAIAGAVTDFTMFNGQEARLSNFIQQYPELQNPVTEFLAHDEDEGEIEGRIKNVLEGLGLEFAALGFIKGLKSMKRGKKIRAEGGSPEEVAKGMQEPFGEEGVKLLPDFGRSVEAAAPTAPKAPTKETPSDPDDDELNALIMDDVSERMKEVESPVSTLDEAIDARPELQSYKTNLEAKRGLEGSRGSEAVKKRLRLEANLKNADPSDVKDIETFIDTIGERMFDDVSLSISSKLDSKGRFEFANSLVTLRKNVVEGGDLTRTGVHELWHSLSRNLPNKDLGRLKAQFTRERNKYLKGTGKDVEDFKKGTYNDDNYRYSDIDEYFAEEMTDAFLSKLDANDALAPQGTFKRVAQEIAIMLKDMFASVKSKLGIDQRQKIFNDFIKQRNVKKQRSGPLDFGSGKVKEMKDFADEVSPEHAGIAKAIARGETVTLPRFETTDQQYSFVDALRKEVASNPKTMKKMEEEAEAGLPVDFGDDTITDLFKNMEQTAENQKQVRFEATVYKKVGAGLVKKLHDIAQEYKASGGGDVATAKLKNAFQEVVGFSEQYFRLGRETSLALGVRRQRMGRRKIGLNEAEMQGEGIRKNYVNENGGMSAAKIIAAIEEGVDPTNFESGINKLFKLARKTQGRKFLDMPTEYWINSILSGPRTQIVNILGNGLTSLLSTIEAAAGGLLTGNMEVTKQAFASWASWQMIKEALYFAGKTAKSGENLLDPNARAFNEGQTDAITPEAFGMSADQRHYKTVKNIGNLIRLPSRLLMTTDEFFKQLNYRRAARFKLAMNGIEQGMTDPKQLAEYITKGLEDVITSGGRHYSEESLIREGVQAAQDKGIKDPKEQSEFVSEYVQDNKKTDTALLLTLLWKRLVILRLPRTWTKERWELQYKVRKKRGRLFVSLCRLYALPRTFWRMLSNVRR